MASQAPSYLSRGTQRAAPDQKGDGPRSVASSQRTTSQAPKDSMRTGQKARFLLRTAAFKKDLPVVRLSPLLQKTDVRLNHDCSWNLAPEHDCLQEGSDVAFLGVSLGASQFRQHCNFVGSSYD